MPSSILTRSKDLHLCFSHLGRQRSSLHSSHPPPNATVQKNVMFAATYLRVERVHVPSNIHHRLLHCQPLSHVTALTLQTLRVAHVLGQEQHFYWWTAQAVS